MKRWPPIRCAFSIAIACCAAQAFAKASHDDLARRPTWNAPTAEHVRQRLEAWWQTQSITPTVQQQLATIWAEPFAASEDPLLDRLAQSVALVDPRAAALVDKCLQPRTSVQLQEQSILSDEELPEWIRHNLSLFYGQWLTGERYYDEARGLLADLTPEQVCDPAALLFYQAVIHHRLLEKDACLAALKRLLQNEPAVPQRYTKLARLMEADLRPLKTDSLDEVARMMESIRVRLGHARAGKRVRQEEEDVIAKLDKMIEQLEEQASQAAAAAGRLGQQSSQCTDAGQHARRTDRSGKRRSEEARIPHGLGQSPAQGSGTSSPTTREGPPLPLPGRD